MMLLWPLPSGLASGSVNAHLLPRPAADVIKCTLSYILYLMDFFHVLLHPTL